MSEGVNFNPEEIVQRVAEAQQQVQQQVQQDIEDNGIFNPQNNEETVRTAEEIANAYEEANNIFSVTHDDGRAFSHYGPESVITPEGTLKSDDSLKDFVERYVGQGRNLTDGEIYDAEKGVLSQNRDNKEFMDSINEAYLNTQIYSDLSSLGVNVNEFGEKEIGLIADFADNNLDLNSVSDPKLRNALQTIQNREYSQFDFSDKDFDFNKVPQEIIELAAFSNDMQLKYESVTTKQQGEGAFVDNKIATDVSLRADGQYVKEDSASGKKTATVPEAMRHANGIADVISNAYGLKNGITTETFSDTIEGIVRANPDKFQGLDLNNATNAQVLQFMAERGITSFDCPSIDISSTDARRTSKEDYMQPNTETRSTQLHVTQEAVKIGEDVNKGLDLLKYVEYGEGGANLKDALQNSIINNIDLNDPAFAMNGSYSAILNSVSAYADDPKYATLRENLLLLQDKFGLETDLKSAIAAAQEGLKGQNLESVDSIKELAAAAVRQELGNNPALFEYFNNDKSDSVFALLNSNLNYIANKTGNPDDNIVKLEDVNLTVRRNINVDVPEQKDDTPPEPGKKDEPPTPTPVPSQPTDPTITDPTVTDPTDKPEPTDPTVTDPGTTDPTITDPTVTDPTDKPNPDIPTPSIPDTPTECPTNPDPSRPGGEDPDVPTIPPGTTDVPSTTPFKPGAADDETNISETPEPTESTSVTPSKPDGGDEDLPINDNPQPSNDPGPQPEPSNDPGPQPQPSNDPGPQPEPSNDPGPQPEPSNDPGPQPEPSNDPGEDCVDPGDTGYKTDDVKDMNDSITNVGSNNNEAPVEEPAAQPEVVETGNNETPVEEPAAQPVVEETAAEEPAAQPEVVETNNNEAPVEETVAQPVVEETAAEEPAAQPAAEEPVVEETQGGGGEPADQGGGGEPADQGGGGESGESNPENADAATEELAFKEEEIEQ